MELKLRPPMCMDEPELHYAGVRLYGIDVEKQVDISYFEVVTEDWCIECHGGVNVWGAGYYVAWGTGDNYLWYGVKR